MPKSADAFRTISEVATELDVPQHVLRFWETKFTQIKPLKRAGGRRYYRPTDVDLIRGIQALLYSDGYTIKGVQRILKDQGVRYVLDTGKTGGPIKTASLGGPIDPEVGKAELPVPPASVASAKPAATTVARPAPTAMDAAAPARRDLSDDQVDRLKATLSKLVALKAMLNQFRLENDTAEDMPLLAKMRQTD